LKSFGFEGFEGFEEFQFKSCDLVFGIWFLAFGFWFLVHGIWTLGPLILRAQELNHVEKA